MSMLTWKNDNLKYFWVTFSVQTDSIANAVISKNTFSWLFQLSISGTETWEMDRSKLKNWYWLERLFGKCDFCVPQNVICVHRQHEKFTNYQKYIQPITSSSFICDRKECMPLQAQVKPMRCLSWLSWQVNFHDWGRVIYISNFFLSSFRTILFFSAFYGWILFLLVPSIF